MGAEHLRKEAATATGITTTDASKLSGADLEMRKLQVKAGIAITTSPNPAALLQSTNPNPNS